MRFHVRINRSIRDTFLGVSVPCLESAAAVASKVMNFDYAILVVIIDGNTGAPVLAATKTDHADDGWSVLSAPEFPPVATWADRKMAILEPMADSQFSDRFGPLLSTFDCRTDEYHEQQRFFDSCDV